jgi:acetyltransferase-like isoleucine patch superfamily enzyme
LTSRFNRAWRIGWTLATLVAVQLFVCGVAATPVVLMWRRVLAAAGPDAALPLMIVSVGVAPSYFLFAVCLMAISAVTLRTLRWRTPVDADMPLADLDWELLRWVRYGASIHLVRVMAGTLFRGTPIWTAYLRLSGARLGKRVYVNSLAVSDYNLLEFGDGVVIGGDVHLSGHTVEGGVVKTARVRLGRNVTIGLGSVIDIGVEIGPDAQVGALSFVPKYSKLEGGIIYVGTPVMPIDSATSRS